MSSHSSSHFPPPAPKWRRYLRFWRPDIHADTDEELRLHLESRVDDLVRSGVTPEHARGRAITEFGDLEGFRAMIHDIDRRIDSRRSRAEWLASLRDDVGYSVRSLLRSKGFVVTVVVAMALGLGLNAAMFTFLDEVFFRPPPGMATPGAVRRLWTWHFKTGDGKPFASMNTTYPAYSSSVESAKSDASIAAFTPPTQARIGRGEGAPTAMLSATTTNYLSVTGARIARGRWFTDAENQLGQGAPVAVVSQRFAAAKLADSSEVLGRKLLVDGKLATIIGLAADDFTGPDLDAVDVWMPIATIADRGPSSEPWWRSESFYGIRTIARLSPGANEPVVAARLTAGARTLERTHTYGDTLKTVALGPVNAARGPDTVAPEITVATRLGAVAVIVLLIACANVVNLLLARAVLRRREIAIRLSLGITRARLVRLMTTESLILSLTAGAAALAAAYWGGGLMRKLLLPTTAWGHSPVSLRLVIFTSLSSIAAGVLIGLIPALRASRPDLASSMRGAGHDAQPAATRLRSSLVATQAALAMVLLVSALLFVASLRNVQDLRIGFDAPRLFFATIAFETPPPNVSVVTRQGYAQLATELEGMPGIEGVALASMAPMRGFSFTNFYSGADSLMSLGPADQPTYIAVSPSYFRTVGLRFVQGRGFAEHAREHGVVVNARLASLLWRGGNPIGQCMRFGKPDSPCFTVIGVVENSRMSHVVESNVSAQFFLSLDDMPPGQSASARAVIVRADPHATAAVTATLRDRLRRVFPGGEPRVKRMVEYLEADYRPYKLGATLFSAFGVLALIVTVVGIYSTVSYSVQQRTREFGIRTALGAGMSDVLKLVLAQELRVAAIGVVTGTLLVLAGGGLLASLLYGIAPRNVSVLTAVALILLMASVAGSLIPALRAGQVDPARTLRTE